MLSFRIWYILIDGREEGPYTPGELKADLRVRQETPARKKGSDAWMPISSYPELKFLFEEKAGKDSKKDCTNDTLAMPLEKEPPFLFFIIFVIVSMIYFLILLN